MTESTTLRRRILSQSGLIRALAAALLIVSPVPSGLAGGEMAGAEKGFHAPQAPVATGPARPDAAELQAHYASRQAAVSATFAETAAIVSKVAYRNAARTAIFVPRKDPYGDPMYVAYGRRAYAGTPWYNGPAYVSSFEIERHVPYEALYGAARLYWPGALSNPGYVPRTDVTLGVGASHSFIQSGMVMDPGSVAPSYARPMQFNNH